MGWVKPDAADLCKAGPHSFPDIGGMIGHDLAGFGRGPGRQALSIAS